MERYRLCGHFPEKDSRFRASCSSLYPVDGVDRNLVPKLFPRFLIFCPVLNGSKHTSVETQMEICWKETVGLYNRTLIHSIFLIVSPSDLLAGWFWHIGKHPITLPKEGKHKGL